MQEKVINIIKEQLAEKGIKVIKIIHFGSRARGDFVNDSDWDFFVVIDKKLSFHQKWDILDEIKIRLAKLKIPNDIILKSEQEIKEAENDVGRITYYILKEGVEI